MYSKESAPIGRRACPARARLSAPNPIQSDDADQEEQKTEQETSARQASLGDGCR